MFGAAKVWLQKAASQGYDEAAKLLVEIATRRAVEQTASEPPPAHEAPRRPTKIETSLPRGQAMTPRSAAAEIPGRCRARQIDALKRLISSGATSRPQTKTATPLCRALRLPARSTR